MILRRYTLFIACILTAQSIMPRALAHEHPPEDRLLPDALRLTFSVHGRELSTTTILPEFHVESQSTHTEESESGARSNIAEESVFEVEGQILFDDERERYMIICRGIFIGNHSEEAPENTTPEASSLMREFHLQFGASVALRPGQETELVRQDGDTLLISLEVVNYLWA